MSRVLAISALVFIGSAGAVSAQRAPADGVYTAEQATAGQAVYRAQCSGCHGPTLGGIDAAAALTGPTFNGNWNGVPLDQMLERVRTTMPVDKPASLSRQQTADVLAYVFSVNKFPSGQTELPRQAEMLSLIQFKATK